MTIFSMIHELFAGKLAILFCTSEMLMSLECSIHELFWRGCSGKLHNATPITLCSSLPDLGLQSGDLCRGNKHSNWRCYFSAPYKEY
jgi:hypothetical protein